ncbi:MAG: PD40 domain-containing protein [Armatimonadetes bacterium]|nr:PD40 domain-containing protein [Armatimonadota bacterium]
MNDQNRPELVLRGRSNSVTSIAFSPDGKTLVSGGYDCRVILWDIRVGTMLRTLEHEAQHCVQSVAFSPDGKIIASADYDTVVLWDAWNGDRNTVLRKSAPAKNSKEQRTLQQTERPCAAP